MQKEWSTPIAAGIALIVGGIALAAVAAVSYADPAGMVFIGIAAIGLIAIGTVALVRRPRLTVTAEPVLGIRTLTSRLDLGADDVERISIIRTRRLGTRNRQLVVDLSDDRLIVFGRWDLGEDPQAVADDLNAAGFRVD